MDEPDYKPRTYLMDEVVPGEVYEIVLTVLKGGAFARYRWRHLPLRGSFQPGGRHQHSPV